MSLLYLENVRVNRRGRSLLHLSLRVDPGEFVAVLGPAGAGKSTLLRTICGLERVSNGRIVIGDRDVTKRAPEQRQTSLVMDDAGLFPHMTVEQNVAFAVSTERADSTPREQVAVALTSMEIDHLAHRYPRHLSTGERQKVALARALVRRPLVMAFDEPLAHVDTMAARSLRYQIARVHTRMNCATLYVTHDIREAMSLATRIIYLEAGELLQDDYPEDIHDYPATANIARHMGARTFLKMQATIKTDSWGQCSARGTLLGQSITIPTAAAPTGTHPVLVCGYENAVRIHRTNASARHGLHGNVGQVLKNTYRGNHFLTSIETEAGVVYAATGRDEGVLPGDLVEVELQEAHLWGLPETQADNQVKPK
ncbi:ABC transporter ATP-binding protein [Gleimia hominis]|uniref:ABC transporter ATP-binding protein n=1 Tax=Gleimia hominis TaxID=595468 RepID=A0ABU3IEQ4_9ACTO|nr:ABC transporter ATP-binding protein [Gleimia hominis]MDT3767720.1 ABC transporter ATP-binding protein [Gleimia hominis]